MSDKFQDQFRIETARAQWWNYGWNAPYFITICTARREHYFGEIISVETGQCPVSTNATNPHDSNNIELQNTMQLSEIGRLAEKFWWSIPEHFSFVKLDVFVVMPNHIHGIIMIDKPDDGRDMDWIGRYVETGQCPVSGENIDDSQTGQCPAPGENIGDSQTGQCPVSTNDTTQAVEPKTPGELRFRNQGKETLSSIVGSFKSVVTKHAHRIHADFEWQERFHDHIIRDTEEYGKIANYIENNVANWQNDKFYET